MIATVTLVVGGLMLIGVAGTLARMLGRNIARPITELTATMGQLASGNSKVAIPHVDRPDELGDMARAVTIFRDAALAKAQCLSGKSLAGAILTNADLPAAVAKFEALDATWEIASRDSNTFIGLLAACVYCWLAIGTTTDVRLITNSPSSPLPVLGT